MFRKNNNIIPFFFIFIVSVILSYSYSFYQVALDGGLVLSGIIDYPNPISPLKYYYHNSWTLLHQVSEILLRLDFSIINASRILLFFSTFSFGIAAYLILTKFTNDHFLSLFVSIIILILQKNFGDTDYPSLIISNHTYGMFGLALSSLIFSLILNSSHKLSAFFSVLLVGIHPVIGIWILSIILLSLLLQRDKKLFKVYLKGFLYGCPIIFLSFIWFIENNIGQISFNKENFKIYMDLWDGHRNQSGFIHYEYLIKTFLLFFIVNFYLFLTNKKGEFFSKFFNLSVVLSSLIYFVYKFFPNLFADFLIKAMPTRFLILHSFVGWPFIIGSVYRICLKFNLKIKFIQKLFLFLVILHSIQQYKNFIDVKQGFLKQLSIQNENNENSIFKEISKSSYEGYFITTKSTTSQIGRIALKPALVHLYSFNFIPYHPYLVDIYFEILNDVYKIDINNPPILNNTDIPDIFIKDEFENKSRTDWIALKKKYNANYVAAPTEWKIQLDLIKRNKFFSIYKIQ